MKVNSNGPGIELLSYLKQIKQQQQKPGESGAERNIARGTESDKVNLSDRSREVQQAFNALKEMPDVRGVKVAQIKMDVENGTYKVVGTQVATKMINESFENNMILQKVMRF